jgi:putative addiction module component (TIGR02574 family)
MARTYEEILKDALTLTEDERVELAESLHDSLLSPEEREIKAEWDAEIARRVADFDAGLTVGIPAEEVIAKARERVREVREARSVRSRG